MASGLPQSPGHPFYRKLNELLAEADFDRWIEGRCRQYYATEEKRGQPSIPPGVYFRMLLVGYFEGIDSQRGIAWRCADSLSLRAFLGIPLDESTPDHSTLTNTRNRLPQEVFDEVFQFVLSIAVDKKLLSGKTVGVDSTTLEANAAMKSIVRRDTGEDWKQYVTRLMREDGTIEADHEPTDEEVRRYDKKRKNKRVSNEEWVSDSDRREPHHPDERRPHAPGLQGRARGRSQERHRAGRRDSQGRPGRHRDAGRQRDGGAEQSEPGRQSRPRSRKWRPTRAITRRHTLELSEAVGLRTYIPEPRRKHRSRWTDKPADYQHAVYANRRRIKRAKSKRYQRLRSEWCERTFAHVCDSGGMRRSWLKGVAKVTKRYLIAVAAHNLGRILRKLFGIGKPKALQGEGGLAALVHLLGHVLTSLSSRLEGRESGRAVWLAPSRPEMTPAKHPYFNGLLAPVLPRQCHRPAKGLPSLPAVA